MHDLKGKVAVVTGGSRGLGAEMVRGFAAAGADVVIASRKLGTCETLAVEVAKQHEIRALPLALHMGRWDDIAPFVDTIYDELGRVDILVNNAGMAPFYDSLPGVTEELFDKVLAVNLKGPFRLSALVGERMVHGDGGAIINISSFAAQHPSWNDIVYAAAKAGLETITKGFAGSMGPKVRVNAIAVGPFLTDISKSWDVEGFERWARERYALQRLGKPAELVGTVMYLSTEMSSFTTGAVIEVSGGVAIASPFPV